MYWKVIIMPIKAGSVSKPKARKITTSLDRKAKTMKHRNVFSWKTDKATR